MQKPSSKKWWLWVLAIVLTIGAIYLFIRYKKKQSTTEGQTDIKTAPPGPTQKKDNRGIRNKNVGNLKIANNAWKGKIPVEKNTDGIFEQFETFEYGIRAMIITLLNYFKKYSLNTVEKIIMRYCPPYDDQLQVANNTENYIKFVSAQLGVQRNQPIDMGTPESIKRLVQAMAIFESSYTISDDMYKRAVKLI